MSLFKKLKLFLRKVIFALKSLLTNKKNNAKQGSDDEV